MNTRAFTLLEILVVVGIIGFVTSIAGSTSIESYQKTLAQEDTAEVSSIMRRARMLSVTGSCVKENCIAPFSHGIMVFPHKIILFAGDSYLARTPSEDISYPLLGVETASGTSEIVFSSYTGRPEKEGAISLINSNGSFWTVTVNRAGAISTNYSLSQ